MSAITIESLGLSKDELANRIVDAAVFQMLNHAELVVDEDGEEYTDHRPTKLGLALQDRIKRKIDEAVDEIAAKNVLPNVASYVENLTLQETNKWGEAKGQKLTFVEYLVQRAEAYIQEPVNYEGKSKDEAGGYGWSKSQTRVAHLIHKHLHYQIETAMKTALADLNKSVALGLHETVRVKLNEALTKLSTEVKVE